MFYNVGINLRAFPTINTSANSSTRSYFDQNCDICSFTSAGEVRKNDKSIKSPKEILEEIKKMDLASIGVNLESSTPDEEASFTPEERFEGWSSFEVLSAVAGKRRQASDKLIPAYTKLFSDLVKEMEKTDDFAGALSTSFDVAEGLARCYKATGQHDLAEKADQISKKILDLGADNGLLYRGE